MIGKLVERLKQAQSEYAHASLAQPGDKSEYEYGQRCGYYAGLLKAEAIVHALLKEEDDNDANL
jgi:hypothetical protein